MNFRKWMARIGGGLALALGGGCTSAATEAPVATAPAAEEARGPALWALRDEDTTIYLFGTVHALPDEAKWFDGRIERAFGASDELVTEIDMDQAAQSAQVLAQAAMLENGQTLRALMTEENRAEYEQVLTKLGLPVQALDPMEPWFAALNLSMLPLVQSGYDPAVGVDMVLSGQGETKKRAALETIEQQVQLFDGLPMDAQLAFLDQAVEAVPQAASTLDAMVALWLAGDADGLAAKMNDELDDPALYQRLLVDRNSRWADWIEQRIAEPGTVFIAVGAGHLAGDASVQALLTERGYEVERVWQ